MRQKETGLWERDEERTQHKVKQWGDCGCLAKMVLHKCGPSSTGV